MITITITCHDAKENRGWNGSIHEWLSGVKGEENREWHMRFELREITKALLTFRTKLFTDVSSIVASATRLFKDERVVMKHNSFQLHHVMNPSVT